MAARMASHVTKSSSRVDASMRVEKINRSLAISMGMPTIPHSQGTSSTPLKAPSFSRRSSFAAANLRHALGALITVAVPAMSYIQVCVDSSGVSEPTMFILLWSNCNAEAGTLRTHFLRSLHIVPYGSNPLSVIRRQATDGNNRQSTTSVGSLPKGAHTIG
eukprot:4435799-Prymnesium_polylepis.3